nr:MAG TPA: HIRAN domain [Caudoviricetes sp.]
MKTFISAFGTWFLTNLIGAFVLKFLGIQISEGLVLLLNVITISFAIFVALFIRRRQLKIRKEVEELNSVAAVEEEVSSEPTPPMKNVLLFELAGLYYGPKKAKERARELMSNESVFLEKDPTNPHDPNAIRVYSYDDVHLGYVPKNLCSEILEYMDRENASIAYVDYISYGREDYPFVHLYFPIY